MGGSYTRRLEPHGGSRLASVSLRFFSKNQLQCALFLPARQSTKQPSLPRTKTMSVTTVLLVAALSAFAAAFPDGGPVDACVKPRPNQPYHGQARPQPLSSNPYHVIASSDRYQPGSQITVRIQGSDFKGFFIQARDAQTNDWIGSWAQTPNTNAHAECSAVTHADPRDKQQATLIWNAPLNSRGGTVYFTGSVLKDYSTFWSDIVSRVGQ